jgi:hypothetical protein
VPEVPAPIGEQGVIADEEEQTYSQHAAGNSTKDEAPIESFLPFIHITPELLCVV